MTRQAPRLLIVATVFAGVAADWPLFRGDAAMTGVAAVKLPDQIVQRWQFKTGDQIEGAPAIVGGVVYVGSYDEHLYALELATGAQKWKTKLGPIKAAPAVKGDAVYVGDADGKFYCVEAATGKVRWTFESDGEIASGANFFGETVLFGSHDENLHCLGFDGKKRWDYKINGPVNGSPAVVGDRTFVAGCDSVLHVVDAKTGKQLATVDLGGQAGATAAVSGEQLFVGTMSSEFLGIDWKKAEVLWKYTPDRRKQPYYASAAVTEKLVIVGGRDRRVVALDRTNGKEIWAFDTGNRVDGSPVVIGNRVYAGSLDDNFYVLDLANGKQLQRIKLDGPVTGSPAVVDGYVLVGTQTGMLYCFGEK
jgi:outer membrane protein assembly factor BamB